MFFYFVCLRRLRVDLGSYEGLSVATIYQVASVSVGSRNQSPYFLGQSFSRAKDSSHAFTSPVYGGSSSVRVYLHHGLFYLLSSLPSTSVMGTIRRLFYRKLVQVFVVYLLGSIYRGIANASVGLIAMVRGVLCQFLRG